MPEDSRDRDFAIDRLLEERFLPSRRLLIRRDP